MIDFKIILSGDNYPRYGVFYVNGSDILEAFEKTLVVKDDYFASYDNFEIITIKLV